METLILNLPPSLGLTEEQFYHLCTANQEWRFELTTAGELIISSPTSDETSTHNLEINAELADWNHQKKIGFVFDSNAVFHLPNGAYRSPDAAWVIRERWEALSAEEKQHIPSICPDFVVEVRSDTDSLEKLRLKMQEYRDNGALLGWLIDPQTRDVEIYRPQMDVEIVTFSFDKPPTLSGEEVLPGFVLDLTPILHTGWEKVDAPAEVVSSEEGMTMIDYCVPAAE